MSKIIKLYTLSNELIEITNYIPNKFTGILEWQASKSRHYYYNSKLHRTDGPAVEYSNGTKWWYLNDKRITEEQHKLYTDIMKLKGLL